MVIGKGDTFLQSILFVFIVTCIIVWNDHSDNRKTFISLSTIRRYFADYGQRLTIITGVVVR